MFDKVLVANRGTIACRIIRTLRRMGIRSVAIYSDADASSLHVSQADEAICIGPPPAAHSYLNGTAILEAARATGAQAIHPGYGFLAENADFAELCTDYGLVFVGPTADNIRSFGLKHQARELALRNEVPLIPGSQVLTDLATAREEAARIGFPVILKATAGGGGIGMKVCEDGAELAEAYPLVTRLAGSSFSDARVYVERYVRDARHVEVQVFGAGDGRVIVLGERDCSLQRRNQKVIEETPAPGLAPSLREQMFTGAARLLSAVQYRSAGTVEYLFDPDRREFFFLEVNTRLQVEHGVTEEVTGIDLVEWMIRRAAGERAFLDDWAGGARAPAGCSIQARIYAEDPAEKNPPPAAAR